MSLFLEAHSAFVQSVEAAECWVERLGLAVRAARTKRAEQETAFEILKHKYIANP
jgi:hypothetical protein